MRAGLVGIDSDTFVKPSEITGIDIYHETVRASRGLVRTLTRIHLGGTMVTTPVALQEVLAILERAETEQLNAAIASRLPLGEPRRCPDCGMLNDQLHKGHPDGTGRCDWKGRL